MQSAVEYHVGNVSFLAVIYLVAIVILKCTRIFELYLGIGDKTCKSFSLICGTDNLVLKVVLLCKDYVH
jgi:hypothetical protein